MLCALFVMLKENHAKKRFLQEAVYEAQANSMTLCASALASCPGWLKTTKTLFCGKKEMNGRYKKR